MSADASFPRGPRGGQYYRGYTAAGSPLQQQYCSNNAAGSTGYHYQYPGGHQTNGAGYRGMQVGHGGSDQYTGYPGATPVHRDHYTGYYDQQHQGSAGGYYPGYSKHQSGFSEGPGAPGYPGYPGEASKSSSGYYYPSCQGGTGASQGGQGGQGGQGDPATANTPLPPDFSYVGSGGPHGGEQGAQGGGYQDFYAMG